MSRPSWDDTWMKVVNAIAERSNDETFKVGAVIVITMPRKFCMSR